MRLPWPKVWPWTIRVRIRSGQRLIDAQGQRNAGTDLPGERPADFRRPTRRPITGRSALH
jgi:hypothetical protein